MATSTNVLTSMAEPEPGGADPLIAPAEKVKFVDIGRRLPKNAGDQSGVTVRSIPAAAYQTAAVIPTFAAPNVPL
jgi:hypothetical protein